MASLLQRWTVELFAVTDSTTGTPFDGTSVLGYLNLYALPEQPPESVGVVIVKVLRSSRRSRPCWPCARAAPGG